MPGTAAAPSPPSSPKPINRHEQFQKVSNSWNDRAHKALKEFEHAKDIGEDTAKHKEGLKSLLRGRGGYAELLKWKDGFAKFYCKPEKEDDEDVLVEKLKEARASLYPPRETDALFRTFRRMQCAYFFVITFCIYVAVSAGFLVQIFFSAEQSLASDMDFQTYATFLFLPLAIVVAAGIGDELFDLVLGSFEDPPFSSNRSMFYTLFHRLADYKIPNLDTEPLVIEPDVCLAVDFVEGLLLESLLVVSGLVAVAYVYADGGVIEDGQDLIQAPADSTALVSAFASGYVGGGIVYAIVTNVVFLASDVYIQLGLVKLHELKRSPKRMQEVIQAAIWENDIGPGDLSKHRHMVQIYPVTRGLPRLRDQDKDERRELMTQGAWFLGLAVAIWIVTMQALKWHIIGHAGFTIAMAVVVALLASWAWTLLHFMLGNTFWFLLFCFGIVAVGLSAGGAQEMPADGVQPLMVPPAETPASIQSRLLSMIPFGFGGLPAMWEGLSRARYPVCSMKWGSPEHNLTVVDMAAFAYNAYEPTKDAFLNLTASSFGGLPGLPEPVHEGTWFTDYSTAFPRYLVSRFPSMSPGSTDTVVIAVKGTSTTADVLMDASLFATIKLLQFFNLVAPVLTSLPYGLVQRLVAMRMPATKAREVQIWSDAVGAIEEYMEAYPRARLLITGHSLGGAVAQVLASRLQGKMHNGVEAVVFSPPGLRFSANRFQIHEARTKETTTVVMPDLDPVPRVDEQLGTVQQILCTNKDGRPPLAPDCHSMARTACELWHRCGDHRGRDFTKICQDFLDTAQLTDKSAEIPG